MDSKYLSSCSNVDCQIRFRTLLSFSTRIHSPLHARQPVTRHSKSLHSFQILGLLSRRMGQRRRSSVYGSLCYWTNTNLHQAVLGRPRDQSRTSQMASTTNPLRHCFAKTFYSVSKRKSNHGMIFNIRTFSASLVMSK